MKTKITGFLVILLLVGGNLFSTLPVGEIPEVITLSEKEGDALMELLGVVPN